MKYFLTLFLTLFLNISFADDLKNIDFNNPNVLEKAELLKLNTVRFSMYSIKNKKYLADSKFNVWTESYSGLEEGIFFELTDNPISLCANKTSCNVIYPMIKIYSKTFPEDELSFKKEVLKCLIGKEVCNAKIDFIFEKTYIYELLDLFVSDYKDLKKFSTSTVKLGTIDFNSSKIEDLKGIRVYNLDFSKYKDQNIKNEYKLMFQLSMD